MEKISVCNIPEVGKVRFEKWSPESQFKNSKIVCSQSWIGIEGQSLNLWNEHIFKVIGHKCGGLLDISKCTVQKNCLSHVVLKIQGKEGALI